MDYPIFFNDENMPLLHAKNINYDDYNTQNTSRVDEITFKTSDTTNKEKHQLYG